MVLRNVTLNDIELIFNLANASNIRKFSGNPKPISWDEHKNWFLKKLADKKCKFFILEHQGLNIGSIRFDSEENGEMVISYLIEPDFQGKGYGKLILKEGVERLKNDKPEIKNVCGFVKKANTTSIKIFERLGYCKITDDGKILKFEKKL